MFFMCQWVLIFNVRMGLKCVYKVIHGTTLWDPFLKCGTVLWEQDQEYPRNRMHQLRSLSLPILRALWAACKTL